MDPTTKVCRPNSWVVFNLLAGLSFVVHVEFAIAIISHHDLIRGLMLVHIVRIS